MGTEQIIRAWKDEKFRLRLSDADRSLVPEHPAGLIEIPEEELNEVVGQGCSLSLTSIERTCDWLTIGCCVGA
ncbi:MAG TPA: mersacidin/lichenicidin family type 2 lantibiotic [Blastocatellia bacterium]|nr:mersacidin/lichenicidin family type 2 lantibiotic [Blastocatellia bacterium]